MITGFEMPAFTFGRVAFTAIGATIYWSVAGRSRLQPYLLGDVIQYLPVGRFRPLIEFLVFLTFGCIVGISFTNPNSAQQAITAGMGWTGLVARAKPGTGNKTKKP